ncbi:MAG TPA: SRPBCC family protein, partial [Candidatus Limnocylindrales bacterium]|nr:SRPBCC family protein [Candidatus Limnocylindrales bacterium]
MPTVVRRIRLDAPPARVWPYLADLDLQLRWMRDLKSVELETPGPIGLGTRALGHVRVFGLPTRDPVEVDAFVPERHLGLRHHGRFTGRGDLWLAPDGSGSRLTWREEFRFRSAGLPLPPLPAKAREAIVRIVEGLA